MTPSGQAVEARSADDPEEEADSAERRRLRGIDLLVGHVEDHRPSLERIVRIAAALAHTPNAGIHIVDETTQRRVAGIGAPLDTSPRDDSFCRLVVESGDAVWTPDATADPRFAASSHVRGEGAVRFYAAAPLDTETHGPLGSLCVWDTRSREDADGVLAELADLAAVVVDVLEAGRTLRLLAEAAATDELTGLPNRRLVYDTITRALAARARHGTLVAVGYIDLDGFKAVNDAHGHEVGDGVLAMVAQRLEDAARSDELVGRIGGDEFVIVATAAGLDHAEATRRLCDAIAEPIPVPGGQISLGASIGVAVAEDGDTADLLLRRADQAMFEVKRQGGTGRC